MNDFDFVVVDFLASKRDGFQTALFKVVAFGRSKFASAFCNGDGKCVSALCMFDEFVDWGIDHHSCFLRRYINSFLSFSPFGVFHMFFTLVLLCSLRLFPQAFE